MKRSVLTLTDILRYNQPRYHKSAKHVLENEILGFLGFSRIWRIMQILEGIIHLNLHNSSYPTRPHLEIAK